MINCAADWYAKTPYPTQTGDMNEYDRRFQLWRNQHCPMDFDCGSMMNKAGLSASECENYLRCYSILASGALPAEEVLKARFNIAMWLENSE